MLKKQVFPFSKIYNYQELYNEAIEFMKVISVGNVAEAEKNIQKIKKNVQLYHFVVKEIREKYQKKQELETCLVHNQRLREEIHKLRREGNGQKKKNSGKVVNSVESQQELKNKIIQLLELDSFSDAFTMASKGGSQKMQQIVQQLWEYKWLAREMDKKSSMSHLGESQFKNLVFLPQRANIKKFTQNYLSVSEHINQYMESVFGSILDGMKVLKLKQNVLSVKLRTQIEAVAAEFDASKRQSKEVRQHEVIILSKLQQYFPDLNIQLGKKSFYSIIQQALLTKGSVNSNNNKSTNNRRMSEQEQDIALSLPTSLGTVKSQRIKRPFRLTPAQLDDIYRKIVRIGMLLKQLNHFSTEADAQYLVLVLDNVHGIMMQRKTDKDLQELLMSQEEEEIKEMKKFNRQLIGFGVIQGLIDVQNQPHNLKRVGDIFFNNVKKIIALIKNNKKQKQKSESHAMKTQRERDSEDILQQKSKSQLIQIIHELHQNIEMLQSQRMKSTQNYREVQVKYQQLQKQNKQSVILLQLPIQSGSVTGDQLLELVKLREEIEKKTVEIEQMRTNIPRLVQEKTMQLKQKYENTLQRIKNNINNQRISMKRISRITLDSRPSCQDYRLQEQKLQFKKRQTYIQNESQSKFNESISSKKQVSIIQNKIMPEIIQIGVGSSQAQIQVHPVKIQQTHDTLNQASFSAQFSEQLQKKTAILQSANRQINELKDNLVELNHINLQQEQLMQNQKVLLDEYEIKIYNLNKQKLELSRELQETKANVVVTASQIQYQQVFVLGSIFSSNTNEERLYLIQTLVNFLGPIKRSHLLYRFDSLNRTNPHRYIDQHKNIVIIAKTIYGKYIAAFSKEAISSAGSKPGFGLLISIWNKNVFQIIKGKRPVTYDDFFIIFGNSELRIKSQQSKVFSNFGINNGYFQHRGHKVESLLGEGEDRQVVLQSYEVYRLDLQKFK